MPYTAQDFARDSNVSRETLADYELWHSLLVKWNQKINLVASAALDDFWRRHALDSWQITQYVPEKTKYSLDLGSGAGFPGISLAIFAKSRGFDHKINMVEAAWKKASFLRTIIRELNLPAEVIAHRVEKLDPEIYDIISARAFAPMDRLFNYAQPFWGKDTIGLFLKGANVDAELTKAAKSWRYNVERIPSVSNSTGSILKITGLTRK